MSVDHLFNLKFAVKQLERESKREAKQEKKEKDKAKKAIAHGNTDIARIHAENAIRHKNQELNYLRMSARVDAVASRVETARINKTVSTDAMACTMDILLKNIAIILFRWLL